MHVNFQKVGQIFGDFYLGSNSPPGGPKKNFPNFFFLEKKLDRKILEFFFWPTQLEISKKKHEFREPRHLCLLEKTLEIFNFSLTLCDAFQTLLLTSYDFLL